jgi:hypothetical protein
MFKANSAASKSVKAKRLRRAKSQCGRRYLVVSENRYATLMFADAGSDYLVFVQACPVGARKSANR